MSNFTKGPWVAYYPHKLLNVVHVSVETEKGREIYTKSTSVKMLDEDTANAHLIASAPEMYEMLENVLTEYKDMLGMSQEVKGIEQLLAKARGEHV